MHLFKKKCYIYDPLPRINTYKNFDKFYSNKYIFNEYEKLTKILKEKKSNTVPKTEYKKFKKLFFRKDHQAINEIRKVILEN